MRELSTVEKQWIFDPETLDTLPSAIHGIPLERELKKRKRTIQSIRSLALRTGLCSHEDLSGKGARGVLTAAATLIHRFYMRRSFIDFPEELMAGTILFLASKIEEEPLKLRHICNTCLVKFENDPEGGWHPSDDHGPPPSAAYRRWEKEILATEEVVLETLCFDVGIKQPWVILRRCTRGSDDLMTDRSTSNGGPAKDHRVTEEIIAELGWCILNEAHLSPLPILHPPDILAFTTFILIVALVERVPLSQATAIASDLSGRFHLDISSDESGVVSGSDLVEVERCLAEFIRYCEMDLIDPALVTQIPLESTEIEIGARTRRYQLQPPNGVTQETKPAVKTPQTNGTSPTNGTGDKTGGGSDVKCGQDSSPKPPPAAPAPLAAQ